MSIADAGRYALNLWRLHLICTPTSVPVSFALLEASHHDLTPMHELCYGLPQGANVYADKAYNSKSDEATLLTETGVKLTPARRKNIEQNTLTEFFGFSVTVKALRV